MNKTLLFVGVFACGALAAAISMWFGIVVPAGDGAEMIYVSGVQQMARTAMMIRQDKHQQLLTNIDLALPSLVEATHSFGDHDYTRWVLWQVRDYYQTCDVPIPSEISQILASLPPRPPRPPTSCQLRRDADAKIASTNNVIKETP